MTALKDKNIPKNISRSKNPGLVHDIHDKIDLGHRIEHCNSTNKVKIKRCARKKRHFYGLLFFLSILVYGGTHRCDDT